MASKETKLLILNEIEERNGVLFGAFIGRNWLSCLWIIWISFITCRIVCTWRVRLNRFSPLKEMDLEQKLHFTALSLFSVQ
jgi:hypothetical protein